MNEKTTLPDVTQQELHIILAGLDELPGKFSRTLHKKICDHVEQWIARKNLEEEAKKDLEQIGLANVQNYEF